MMMRAADFSSLQATILRTPEVPAAANPIPVSSMRYEAVTVGEKVTDNYREIAERTRSRIFQERQNPTKPDWKHRFYSTVLNTFMGATFVETAFHYAKPKHGIVAGALKALVAGARVLKTADFQVSDSPLSSRSVAAGLAGKLVAEFSKEEFQTYLSKLHAALASAKAGESRGEKINLWEWTLERTGNDRAKALLWLALITQEPEGWHVRYLKRYGSSTPERLQTFAEVVTALPATSIFHLYPRSVNAGRAALYHYYVPAYLGHEMARLYPKSSFARFLPFGINTSYEFFTDMGNKERLEKLFLEGNAWAILKHIFVETWKGLRPYTPGSYPLSEQDTYLGYAAFLTSLGRENDVMSFEDFSREFSKDPESFMGKMLGD